MNDEPTQNSYTRIVDLIFENAKESIEGLDRSINSLNAQLSAVAGFSAALIRFAGDLPDQSAVSIDSLPCYTCSLLKISSLILLSTVTLISLSGFLPKDGGEDQIISPAEQVEKCIDLSEAEYKLLFISQYDRDIESLNKLRIWKAKRLILSGRTFVAAAFISALNLILATALKS
jgi:hypothetical protein